MKNIIINNGKATVTVTASHNVTVTEKSIVIDLVKVKAKYTTKLTKKATTKATTKPTTTKRKAGRPKKNTTVK